jgi:hypothetical protein
MVGGAAAGGTMVGGEIAGGEIAGGEIVGGEIVGGEEGDEFPWAARAPVPAPNKSPNGSFAGSSGDAGRCW